MYNLYNLKVMKVNLHAVNFNVDKKLVDFIKDRRKIETKPREMNLVMKDDQGHNFLLNQSEILAAKKSGILIPDSIISKTNIGKNRGFSI